MNYQQLFYVYTHSSTHRTKFIRLFIYSQKLISWLFNDLPRRECADVGHKRTIGRPAKMAWKKILDLNNKLYINKLLPKLWHGSDFIYTKISARPRSDFIYTKKSARPRADFTYTKNSAWPGSNFIYTKKY